MTTSNAANIIQALADGQDPVHGGPLPEDSPCHHPDVIRALYSAKHALAVPTAPSRPMKPQPAKAGQPWTDQEDRQLCDAFDVDTPIPVIARNHGRTSGAIRSRLVHLEKIAR